MHRAFGKLLSVDVSGTAITDDGIQLILGASKVFDYFVCLWRWFVGIVCGDVVVCSDVVVAVNGVTDKRLFVAVP